MSRARSWGGRTVGFCNVSISPSRLLRATSARVGSNSSTSLRFTPSIAHQRMPLASAATDHFSPVWPCRWGSFRFPPHCRRLMQRPVDRHLGQVKPDDPVIPHPRRDPCARRTPPAVIHSSRRDPSLVSDTRRSKMASTHLHDAPVTNRTRIPQKAQPVRDPPTMTSQRMRLSQQGDHRFDRLHPSTTSGRRAHRPPPPARWACVPWGSSPRQPMDALPRGPRERNRENDQDPHVAVMS